MITNRWKSWILILSVVVVLAGCTKEKPVLDAMPEDGSGKVRVMYFDQDQFMRSYGSYFNLEFPNVEIEVVKSSEMYAMMESEDAPEDPKTIFSKFMKDKQVDVIFTSTDKVGELAAEGKLYNLDGIIAEEKINFDDYLPGLIDILRDKGDGSLFGLTPNFSTQVLYYNADLFKEKGISPPTNKMTWQQIIDLGSQFSHLSTSDDKYYGITSLFSSIDNTILQVAQAANLQVVDARGEKILIDSPGWRELLTMVGKGIKDQTIQVNGDKLESGASFNANDNPFMKGKAAMMIEGLWTASQLNSIGQYDKKVKPFEWGMVTPPINPAKPDENPYISLYNVFAINNDSPNKRAAWELIKFMQGEKMAKINAAANSGEVPSRISFVKQYAGKPADPITMMRPSPSSNNMYLSKVYEMNLSPEFVTSVQQLLINAVKDIAEGKNVDDIVPPVQLELQKQLEDAKRKSTEKSDASK